MNNEIENKDKLTKRDYLLSVSIILSGLIFSVIWLSFSDEDNNKIQNNTVVKGQNTFEKIEPSALEKEVLPIEGVELPVVWGDLGKKLISVGVIDQEKFIALYDQRGQYTKEAESLLTKDDNGKIRITEQNSGYLLNLFWALGLGNKNSILEKGEISDPRYGGAGRFASTGGWTLAQGNAMDHFSRHKFFNLTPEQQLLVEKIAKGVYRPCCNNSTHFPDCNHGMAMLGLLQLMASQGINEEEMWKTALTVNSYWFPDTYLTIATYMKNKGIEWKDVSPEEMLGVNYSSASGYTRIASQITAPTSSNQSGSGCGVDSGSSAPVALISGRQTSGCGI